MKKLYLSEQVKEYEKKFFAAGNSDKELMLSAAKIVTNYISKNYKNKKVICICGPGNNGGDGYYVGLNLYKKGFSVKIIDALEKKSKSPLCKEAFDAAVRKNLIHSHSTLNSFDDDILVIDAIFGTSYKSPLDKKIIELIKKINLYKSIVSIDLPSGINPDTGVASDHFVKANVNICFIGRKLGMALNEGKISAEINYFHKLGLEMEEEVKQAANHYSFSDIENLITTRSANCHKGDFGNILVLGGDKNFGGASIMAAETALKSGSGLVSLLTQPIHIDAALIRNPEIMTIGLDKPCGFESMLNDKDVFVCGPGLSSSDWSEKIIKTLIDYIKNNECFALLDAGALRYIAKKNINFKSFTSSIVLTPHPGEAADLLGISSVQVQSDRIKAAKDLVTKYNATIVLKGAGTIIANKETICICRDGGPELASGGTGDILAGLIGSLMAQGLSAYNACLLGVAVHGRAGNEFLKLCGVNGLAATELIPLIRGILNKKK